MAKPSLPQGTRDFAADVVRKRNYILGTIKNIFERYGFEPLETPAMENLDTLMVSMAKKETNLFLRFSTTASMIQKTIDKSKARF